MKTITGIIVLFVLIINYSWAQRNNKEPKAAIGAKFNDISKSDTACLRDLERAKRDILKKKLVYCYYVETSAESFWAYKEMTNLLKNTGITYVKEIYPWVKEENRNKKYTCYCEYMKEYIDAKFGQRFMDSLRYIADSTYFVKNLDLNNIFDWKWWDKRPIFPGDKELEKSSIYHPGLQLEFEKLITYPTSYVYKADSNSLALIKVFAIIDEKGKAKVTDHKFIFYNNKTKEEGFNKDIYTKFEGIIIPLIENAKWTPAAIKSIKIKSENQFYIILK